MMETHLYITRQFVVKGKKQNKNKYICFFLRGLVKSRFYLCIYLGHWEGVDLLLSRFSSVIDVNVRNTSGLTPLMKAALQGRTRCAKRLLIAGMMKINYLTMHTVHLNCK